MLLHSRPQTVDAMTNAACIELERQLDAGLLQCGFLGYEFSQNSQAGQVVAFQHKVASSVLTA